eukprot:TRINITY_DN1794_c0_g1_i1.p2 TRINITY_DN1794_c0_g1~~TRINITY_DN1794_c0_g1_i1.p2  ORF type:complete len:206 (-),score=14.87 TRINITY_DN1794_c0_g1_i1:142-759(-)
MKGTYKAAYSDAPLSKSCCAFAISLIFTTLAIASALISFIFGCTESNGMLITAGIFGVAVSALLYSSLFVSFGTWEAMLYWLKLVIWLSVLAFIWSYVLFVNLYTEENQKDTDITRGLGAWLIVIACIIYVIAGVPTVYLYPLPDEEEKHVDAALPTMGRLAGGAEEHPKEEEPKQLEVPKAVAQIRGQRYINYKLGFWMCAEYQ